MDKLKEKLIPIVDEFLKGIPSVGDTYLNNPQGVSLANKISCTLLTEKIGELLTKVFVLIFELLEEQGILEEKPYLQINSNGGADTGIAVFYKGKLVFNKFLNVLSINPANPTKKEEFTRTASSWASDIRNGVRNGYRPEEDEEEDPWWNR